MESRRGEVVSRRTLSSAGGTGRGGRGYIHQGYRARGGVGLEGRERAMLSPRYKGNSPTRAIGTSMGWGDGV